MDSVNNTVTQATEGSLIEVHEYETWLSVIMRIAPITFTLC